MKFQVKKIITAKILENGTNTGKVREFCQSGKAGTMTKPNGNLRNIVDVCFCTVRTTSHNSLQPIFIGHSIGLGV